MSIEAATFAAGAAPASVAHGRVLFVHEILALGAAANNLSVCVTGCLAGVVRASRRASLMDPRSAASGALEVDTSQVDHQNYHDDELVRLIGELCVVSADGAAPVLRARTLRNVDGLDLDLFTRAVIDKRAYETEIGTAPVV